MVSVAIHFMGPRTGRHVLEEGETWLVGLDSGFENMAPRELSFTLSRGEVTVQRLVPPALKKGLFEADDLVMSVGNGSHWEFFLGHGYPRPPFEPRCEQERTLFDALARDPGAEDVRQIYGDWLEENGHAKEAEVLRIERRVWGADGRFDEGEYGRLGYRLRRSAKTLLPTWREVAMRPAIVGCERGTCPRSWERLIPVGESCRTCTNCERKVWLADTAKRATWYRRSKQLLAVDVGCGYGGGNRGDEPSTDNPIYGLPFFAYPDPSSSIGEVLRRLRVARPPCDRAMPVTLEPTPGGMLRATFLRHRNEPCDGGVKTLSQAVSSPCCELRLAFHGDGSDVEAWLNEHHGEARAAGAYRKYGHWLFRQRREDFVLWWFERLPRFMTDVDPTITLAFLRELMAILADSTNIAQAREFAARPPRRSGIVVDGDSPINRFHLSFAPSLDALELAKVLDIEVPASWDDPYDMHWPLRDAARHPKPPNKFWWIDTWLAEAPRDFDRLTRRDQVTGLSFSFR